MYQNEKHKQIAEKRNYDYICSYDIKEITIDGKNKKKNKIHIRIKCPYCKREYDVDIYTFKNGSRCRYCCSKYENSFAYHIEEELGEDLNKYWDWEENSKRGVNPRDITMKSEKTIYIWCQNKWYHGSYKTMPSLFYKGRRCSYCNPFASHKIHPLDSFGTLYPKKAKYWDYEKNKNKNKNSPYKVAPKSSMEKYWFKCEKCGKSFERNLNNMNRANTGVVCDSCSASQLEEKCIEIFNKYNIEYEREKEFKKLIGEGNRPLRYDFYLPKKNKLIECNGKQHEEYTPFFYKTFIDFKRQQKHDERKREYAKENNIKLIEIRYYDINNIEQILLKELNITP